MIAENVKGVILLSATGYIQVRAYASTARFPLKDVAITVTSPTEPQLPCGSLTGTE